jgi:hypothetical protein
VSKRTVTRLAQKQYAGDVQPWLRWSLGIGALVLIALKLAGVL